jgi:16S rRNA (cytidine1402-2'-O)-methyltransferase
MAGRLFRVSTPIGNLGDMTFRAVETLRAVAVVLAEDTRHSRPLLDHFEVPTPSESYHEHNEARMTPRVLERLTGGEDVALISDAGTPLLSDPGERLVRAALEAGVQVVPVPGASALLAGLVASGLSTAPFTFHGFLPRKGRERQAAMEALSALRHTGGLYEAPSRVASTLSELSSHGCAGRTAVVARELTKQFEEFRRGTVEELAQYYAERAPRGEVVIFLEGRRESGVDTERLTEAARALRAQGLSSRDVAAALQSEYGAPRNLAYELAHER